MTATEDFKSRTFYLRQAFLLLAFNLLPGYFVLMGEWTPFEVIAFYWVEVVAAGVFALLRTLIAAVRALFARDIKGLLGHIATATFMPVHFGFFIVMSCFLVGAFLPEGTPTQKLTGPLIPLYMVAENIKFFALFPFFMLWEAALFLRESWHAQHDHGYMLPNPVAGAYTRLGILFVSGFFGLLLAGWLDERLWGAVVLITLKILCVMLPLYVEYRSANKSTG